MADRQHNDNVNASAATPYRGRFAPTPSGPLHLGSLLTALASWLDARRAQGQWLLRIDDLDGPRVSSANTSTILRQLEAHGLAWDGAPMRESRHLSDYRAALDQLAADGLLYACDCTRAGLQQRARPGPDGPVYDGHCRHRALPLDGPYALRLRVPALLLQLNDRIQGPLRRDADGEVGDFVVRRRDGIAGYQLACACDELILGISDVVRGADLLGSSFCQRLVIGLLGGTPPRYAHLPVLLDPQGRKLSKQNHAAPLDSAHAGSNLLFCLRQLAQHPPDSLQHEPVDGMLRWAVHNWTPEQLPALREIPCFRATAL